VADDAGEPLHLLPVLPAFITWHVVPEVGQDEPAQTAGVLEAQRVGHQLGGVQVLDLTIVG
jgi:hypothetical protein